MTIQSFDGEPRSPEAVLQVLKAQAEHKASLRMFFAAADLCQDYRGPWATETQAERERLAEEYEQRGRAAEHERAEHGLHAATLPPPVSPAPAAEHHSAEPHWHCPACQARFPDGLIVCPYCGLDFRTGQKFVSAHFKPSHAASPFFQVHNHTTARHRSNPAVTMAIWAAICTVLLIAVIMAVRYFPKTEPPENRGTRAPIGGW